MAEAPALDRALPRGRSDDAGVREAGVFISPDDHM